MKIAVVILIVLGLVAAGASAIVVQMLTVRNAEATPMVTVVQAQSVIPALTVLKREHLVEEKAPPSGLPVGYLSSPAQGIGRVLRVPVEEGQVLAQDYFVPGGTASDMIKLIPRGMLAYSVTLSTSAVNRHLLYPGCVVDILAVFRLSRSAKGEAIALTLLQNLQVVAIEDETVLSHRALEGRVKKRTSATSSSQFVVTFKVTPEEAKALQLGAKYGGIALALRNPTDTDRRDVVAMVLNQGQLSEWAQDLDPGALIEQMREIIVAESASGTEAVEPNRPVRPGGTPSKVSAVPWPPDQGIEDLPKSRRMNWKVTFIEGTKPPQEINFSLEQKETDN